MTSPIILFQLAARITFFFLHDIDVVISIIAVMIIMMLFIVLVTMKTNISEIKRVDKRIGLAIDFLMARYLWSYLCVYMSCIYICTAGVCSLFVDHLNYDIKTSTKNSHTSNDETRTTSIMEYITHALKNVWENVAFLIARNVKTRKTKNTDINLCSVVYAGFNDQAFYIMMREILKFAARIRRQ